MSTKHYLYFFLSLWMKPYYVTIQMKAIDQYFTLPKVVLTFKSANETVKCDHSKYI